MFFVRKSLSNFISKMLQEPVYDFLGHIANNAIWINCHLLLGLGLPFFDNRLFFSRQAKLSPHDPTAKAQH